jgi:hypothetical protein
MRHAQSKRKYLNLTLRAIVSGGILFYLFSKLNIGDLKLIFLSADPASVVLAAAFLGLSFLLCSVRWWLLLKVQSIDVTLGAAVRLTFIGLYFNNFLLGSFGGDIVRAFYIMKSQPHKRIDAGLSIVADRFLGMFVLLCIVAVIVPWKYEFLLQRAETSTIIDVMIALLLGALLAIAAIAVMGRRREIPALARLAAIVRRWESAVTVFRSLLSHHAAGEATMGAFLTSIFVTVGTAMAGLCIARAIDLDINFTQMLVILAFVICMMSLPISVAGHGIREAAFIVMFLAFGIRTGNATASQGYAVAFSLIYYALHLFWGLVGGLVFVAGGSRLNIPPDTEHCETRPHR